jgi:hypothetical protein
LAQREQRIESSRFGVPQVGQSITMGDCTLEWEEVSREKSTTETRRHGESKTISPRMDADEREIRKQHRQECLHPNTRTPRVLGTLVCATRIRIYRNERKGPGIAVIARDRKSQPLLLMRADQKGFLPRSRRMIRNHKIHQYGEVKAICHRWAQMNARSGNSTDKSASTPIREHRAY